MTKRTIKPAVSDLVVRRPENGKRLAPQGEEVEWSAHWQRRFNDGDVVDAPAVPNTAQDTQGQQEANEPPVVPEKKGGAK